MSANSTNDIENRFAYHPPKDNETVKQHEAVRNSMKTVAHYFEGFLPMGREKSLALTKLEEAMFWANAAIARSNENTIEVNPGISKRKISDNPQA